MLIPRLSRRAAVWVVGLALLVAHDQKQPLDSHRIPDGRRRLAAEHLDQTVVAASAAEGVLRAELAPVSEHLEQRAAVVVEAAHEAGFE